jgi:hypothetical protein
MASGWHSERHWRGIAEPTVEHQMLIGDHRSPKKASAGNGVVTLRFHPAHFTRAVPALRRSAESLRSR